MGGATTGLTHPVVTAELVGTHRRGCPSPGGPQGAGAAGYPRVCLEDFHNETPNAPEHLPCTFPAAPVRGASESAARITACLPQGLEFCPLSAFPQCHLPDIAFDQGIKGHASSNSHPPPARGRPAPCASPRGCSGQEDVCGCKSQQSCCSALF